MSINNDKIIVKIMKYIKYALTAIILLGALLIGGLIKDCVLIPIVKKQHPIFIIPIHLFHLSVSWCIGFNATRINNWIWDVKNLES